MHPFLKFVVITASLFMTFISTDSIAKSNQLIPAQTKIVGGEVAEQGDWPWMSALVFTQNKISTSLIVDNINYNSQAFTGGVAGSAAGSIIDCGMGATQCANASNKICLIERGDNTFALKVENCQAGGGIGAIIYNNIEGAMSGTLGEDFTGTIPVISVTQADGVKLKANIGANASLTVSESTPLTQSSTCGASFLGNKWVLTAAHCVEGVSSQLLKVNVGEYDLSNGAENAVAVKRIYMHGDYELGAAFNNDIALIELVNEVDNPAITFVNSADTEVLAIQKSSVTVIGWGGRLGYGPNGGPTSNFPDVLHQVDLQLSTNNECKDILAQSSTQALEGTFTANSIGVTDAMICAFTPEGGKGSCQGDSGGPLIVNTNEGWQQIGIVSWGVGCAAQGFPGVYTRTANFIDWVNEITKGIAIDQVFDFATQAITKAQSTKLEVFNNSHLDANLTFTINGDTNFTIANDNCNNIAAGASCLLQVNYDAAKVGKHSANIVISSDNNQIATSSTKLLAQTVSLANNIKTQLSNTDNALTWYSGGNKSWQLDNTEAAIISGNITHNEDSVVLVTLSGAGELSFEWSVSSEENTENPAQPFDALYLYVDGALSKFISGDKPYTSETVSLTTGEHSIAWVYKKDAADPAGLNVDDNAHIRKVVFTPTVIVAPTPPVTPTTPQASSGGGGSITWLSLIFLAIVRLYRK